MVRPINASAPVRICDIGGWTDTWFAQHGAVLSIAVEPRVHVQIFPHERAEGDQQVTVYAANYKESFVFAPTTESPKGKHALIEAAFCIMQIPSDLSLDVHLYSDIPPGAGMGTSAAMSVALIAALDRLTPGQLSPPEVAAKAHKIETKVLGLESGTQDQYAAAMGGINFLSVWQYPDTVIYPVMMDREILWELERRLVVVHFGTAHCSSEIHKAVIAELKERGIDDRRIEALRALPERARRALHTRDLEAFGNIMISNTELQQQLHKDLLPECAEAIIELARRHGAIGWKLNGAGGWGGSLTFLMGQEHQQLLHFCEHVAANIPSASVIPIRLSPDGLRVWRI